MTILIVIGILSLILIWYYSFFIYIPKRVVPKGRFIVSPADGKVLSIIRQGEHKNTGKFFGGYKNNCLINIMMTPFNFHYQRTPINGVVKKISYHKGSFYNAITNPKKALMYNERNEILLHNKKNGDFLVVQIAGKVARRIECFVKAKERLKKGDLLGKINLGSQVAMLMPNKINVIIREGAKVKAGETIIGKY